MNTDISVNEAAKIIGTTPRTVRRLIIRGRFPGAYKLDPESLTRSHYRIPVSDIERFLKYRAVINKQEGN